MRSALLHLGYLDAMRCRFVARDALIQRFRDLLAIGVALQVAFVGRTAHK